MPQNPLLSCPGEICPILRTNQAYSVTAQTYPNVLRGVRFGVRAAAQGAIIHPQWEGCQPASIRVRQARAAGETVGLTARSLPLGQDLNSCAGSWPIPKCQLWRSSSPCCCFHWRRCTLPMRRVAAEILVNAAAPSLASTISPVVGNRFSTTESSVSGQRSRTRVFRLLSVRLQQISKRRQQGVFLRPGRVHETADVRQGLGDRHPILCFPQIIRVVVAGDERLEALLGEEV